MDPSIGKASALVTVEVGSTVAWAAGCTRGAKPPPSAVVLYPPPCCTNDYPSLGSFHPCGSDHPAWKAGLTQREVSHFIVTMAARS